jgi:hypothetical protein
MANKEIIPRFRDYLETVRGNYSMPLNEWLDMAIQNRMKHLPEGKITEILHSEEKVRQLLRTRENKSRIVALVENDSGVMKIENRVLTDAGYEVLPFDLPSNCIRCLYTVPGQHFPQIFLVGIRANPERDGPERLHQFTLEKAADLTFIYTSGANSSDVNEVVDRTRAYINYHTHMIDLIEVIERFVAKDAARRSK